MSEQQKTPEHAGPVLTTVDGIDVIDCQICGFKHILPLPSDEELKAFYEVEYFETDKSTYIDEIHEDIEWWNIAFNDKYDTFEQFLEPHQRTILDIGCGYGHFLQTGEKRGWHTTGIEPSKTAFNYSKNELNLNVLNCVFDNQTRKSLEPFDVIHLAEVLEHIRDPHDFLVTAYHQLKPGGLMCVEVPNDYSPFQRSIEQGLGQNPWWVYPKHHLNYFDFESLGRLMEKVGLELVSKDTTFPMDMFILMGKNYVGDSELGRMCHGLRKNFDQNMNKSGHNDAKKQMYQKLAEAGIGREVIITARKPL